MDKELMLKKHIVNIYWFLTTMISSLMMFVTPVFADTGIWTMISNVVKDVYTQILAISTLVAVTAAAIALIVRMISRNQRAVDEATSWLKRIVITWIILNTLGFIIAYLQSYMQGGQYQL